ncbi:hypothetical protein ACFL3H_01110 [Gemmatimonadota bacterium]
MTGDTHISPLPESPEPFSSNPIRLSVREWLITFSVLAGIALTLPGIWWFLTSFDHSTDYRIPYNQSEDYWLYRHYARSAAAEEKTLLIGDSVIWGQYVDRDQTLTHYLNEQAGGEEFLNMGLDGTHQIALAGLIRHYGRAIRDRDVIVHLNLLWLSSPEADLQAERGVRLNHPRLVPQFGSPVPSYTESVSGRISIVLERKVRLFEWARHLRSTSFDNTNLQVWTAGHPYTSPLGSITFRIPDSDEHQEPSIQSGVTGRQIQQSLPWVERETSLQWEGFKRLIGVLHDRNNRVSVIVGPLNEHALDDASRQEYRHLLLDVQAELTDMGLDALFLPLLPAELYADTSHPIGPGYALMAEEVWEWFANRPGSAAR